MSVTRIATLLDLNGEAQVFGPIRLVLRADNVTDHARPGIGAAVQFLDEAKHGVASPRARWPQGPRPRWPSALCSDRPTVG